MNRDSPLEFPVSTLGISSTTTTKQEGRSKELQENLVSSPGSSNSLFPWGGGLVLSETSHRKVLPFLPD